MVFLLLDVWVDILLEFESDFFDVYVQECFVGLEEFDRDVFLCVYYVMVVQWILKIFGIFVCLVRWDGKLVYLCYLLCMEGYLVCVLDVLVLMDFKEWYWSNCV